MSDQVGKTFTYLNIAKMLGGWIFALAVAIIGVIFWVQDEGSSKYYPKLKGEALEKQVQKLDETLSEVEKQNNEMIRILYEMKGRSMRVNDGVNP